MSFDPTGKITDAVNRNAELAQAAMAKARALRDGTPEGDTKAELILALDAVRVQKNIVAIWRIMGDDGDSTKAAYAKAVAELETAKNHVIEVARRLDDLGVKLSFVRRDDYKTKP